MAVRITLRHAPPFNAARRCHLFLLNRPPSPRYSSDFSQLREKMIKRVLPYTTDYVTPTQTRALRLTLADFLPPSEAPKGALYQRREENGRDRILGPTHHLVYFPSVSPTSLLLPDGTDYLHSPGPPLTQRMWAGGSMAFLLDIHTDGHPYHITESIGDVQVKGKEGEEKIFVRVQRLIFAGKYPGELKTRLRIVEQRTLVFMRDYRQEGSPAVSQSSSKVLKPTQTPDFSHKMVPTRELLFRFSALTFNAHAIHLDKQFCREVEGHRNLLVHGPLTVVLMIEVLRTHLQTLEAFGFSFGRRREIITHIEYRNLAPLYAEEEMKVCVKRREKEVDKGRTSAWDVWIEGRDGGYAVKGTVKTVTKSSGLDERFTNSRSEKGVSGQGIAPQMEGSLEGETIPEEQVALQMKARHEPVLNEKSSVKEDLAPEQKTEKQTEDEAEDETAPYFQR